MMTKKELHTEIETVWRNNLMIRYMPDKDELVDKIHIGVDAIIESTDIIISSEMLSRIFDVSVLDEKLWKILNYLCGYINVLDMKFRFIDGEYSILLDNSVIRACYDNESFYHPVSNELVLDYKTKIFMEFEVTDNIINMRNEV